MVFQDEEARRAAIRERTRNVLVDASAGTGKTELIIDRLLELIAPTDGRDAIPIDRIAAITFTRKAAGELRVRARQRILGTLAALPSDAPRAAALFRALGGIDTAHIGTIHSFADRILRKWPSQARLDPQYELVEDDETLIDACFQLFIQSAQTHSLAELLRGSTFEGRAEEAIETIEHAQRAGLRLRSLVTEHWTYHGLDGLVAGFILHRDVELDDPAPCDFDRGAFRRFAEEYLGRVAGLSVESSGGRWLVDLGRTLALQQEEPDPAVIYSEVVDRLERGPRGRASDGPSLRLDFASDERAWDVWKALVGDERAEPVRATSLRDDLLAPLRRWLAVRLVRLRPVVLQLYEIVKRRHRSVDHVDLLLKLRDLLRDDRAIRRACQQLFDHIFVDEFQDTDPLQAQIVLFLCEQGTSAASWSTVALAPGTLTIVGDPKQSIYRFRRADIGTYQRVVDIVRRSPHLSVRLTSSHRSAHGLVDWINDRFASILGVSEHGETFQRQSGEVYYHPLTKGRGSGPDPTVHAVAMDLAEPGDVAAYRTLEAAVMARYVRWLVEVSGIEIPDRMTGVSRPIRYGDIGVLAITTTSLPILFEAFDRDHVPHAERGGTLFLANPLQRRFLLGLCALADRDDGVAVAALLRPPFFAVDLADLAREQKEDPADPVQQARAVIRELRRRRFERSPGQTARALLEETGIGRVISLGPNGAQRVEALRELCFQVEARALGDGLDFDATIERLRRWVDEPAGLDRPQPVAGDAVRALTIHQAKGLEFPVVVLWDSRASWNERTTYDAWTVERDARGWALRLDSLRWEEPVGLDVVDKERAMRRAERKRLVYVAATRARSLLVIPKVGPVDERWIFGRLLAGRPLATVWEQPLHEPEAHAAWFDAAVPPAEVEARGVTSVDTEIHARWRSAATVAVRERMRPVAFTDVANPRSLWGKKGRYGTAFGETVHLAIGIAMRGGPVGDALRRAVARTGLVEHLAEVEADVSRAIAALQDLHMERSVFELEYPISGVRADGRLVSGYIDLLAVGETATLLDFKTDAPPAAGEAPPQRYVEQTTGYADVVGRALSLQVKAGLLYTADGEIRWL